MNVLWTMVVGLTLGLLVKLLLRRYTRDNFLIPLVIGLAGSLGGFSLGHTLPRTAATAELLWVLPAAGSVLLLTVYTKQVDH